MESVKYFLELLNSVDECTTIEAKRSSAIDKSIMETVCAFSNEPGLGGGYLLLGIEQEERSLFPEYAVCGIKNPDKLQLDLASQCASMFNAPVRPQIEVESTSSGPVLKVFIPELPAGQKPLYFKNEGLPKGALRRIGSSDQRCTEDDLFVFYGQEDRLENAVVSDATLADLSEEAIELYRTLRGKVNAFADELSYNDTDLLYALGCIKKEPAGTIGVTYAGLLMFGKRISLRRLLPMVRVDYIRVPGTHWVQDPDSRFTTVDMRGPLIELVQRTFSAIADDLPKGFLLPEGQIQADALGLPTKVLREAIVNALMHRTYRENQPIQVIRYGNRIEIRNPGFSLKPEEQLGEPGSKSRNPYLASIFHDTNLAETKGSGIRTMRLLMDRASMAPPTFESDHAANQFTIRLLLHHFLNEEDIQWLRQFDAYELSDAQKRGLIFLRESHAVNNAAYRQVNGCDILKASTELRALRDKGFLQQKGKGKNTYYVGTPQTYKPQAQTYKPDSQSTEPLGQSTELPSQTYKPQEEIYKPQGETYKPQEETYKPEEVPAAIADSLKRLGKKAKPEQIEEQIVSLCAWQPLTAIEIARLIQRNTMYVINNYITPLRLAGKLAYTIPEEPHHPAQKYKVP